MSDKQIVEYDSAPRVAYDLMQYISSKEFETKQTDHGDREYWLNLYEGCYRVSRGYDR